jgi:homocitrate synthase NifV
MTCNQLPAIIVNDSTLRSVRSPLSRRDQIDIATALERAGVDEIELGLPSGSGAIEDLAFVGAALCRSQPIISGPATRAFVNAAIRTGFDAIYLSASLSVSRGGRAALLAGIRRVVSYAAEKGLAVALEGEDASRSDLDLVCDVIAAAETAGARRFRYTDTTGVLHPIRTHCQFRQLCAETDLELEFRGHDHFGLATANTLAAIQGGATHISVSAAGPDLETRPAQLAGVTDAIRRLGVHHTHVNIPQLPVLGALVAARTPWLAAQKAPWPRQTPRIWDPSGVAKEAGGSDHAPR